MLEVKNTRVYGLEESIVAGAYPMETDWPSDEQFNDNVELIKNYDAGISKRLGDPPYARKRVATSVNLGNVATGTGHDNFLKGVIVQFDIKYANYWTPQFQRYSFHDIVSSSSKMHRLTQLEIGKSCNKYVDGVVIDNLNKWVDIYNNFEDNDHVSIDNGGSCEYINTDRGYNLQETKYIKTLIETEGFTVYSRYEIFMKIVSNAPLGLEQFMRVTSNYLQLKTIYLQRKNHKLKEDWGNFCAWCERLPHFVEFCLKGERKFTNEDGVLLAEYNYLENENN